MTENDGTVPARRGPAAVGDSEPADRLRWGRVVVVVAVGLGIAGVACALPLVFGEEFGTWQGILASTLAAGGMNVLLAAALIWIERKLVQHVRVAASESATAAVEEGTRDLRENTAHLAQRLDEIDDQLNQRHDRQQSQRAEILDELAERPSWDVLASAIREADRLNAVVGSEITAPLTGDIAAHVPRITVQLAVMSETNHGSSFGGGGWVEDILQVEVSAGGKSALVTWRKGETAGEMLGALADKLTREGMNSTKFDVAASTVFPSLKTALEQAITTRADHDPWFTGRMIERIDDDWVVTDRGLESRSFQLALKLDESPSRVAYGVAGVGGEDPALPDPPAGVDPGLWEVAVSRTRHHSHARKLARIMGPRDIF